MLRGYHPRSLAALLMTYLRFSDRAIVGLIQRDEGENPNSDRRQELFVAPSKAALDGRWQTDSDRNLQSDERHGV
ncbi:hypothetical protein M744_02020 [Synechococcus elongatus UTEX 2973]|nr:hypothetical protein M744_02020 [Synechococcus elongatus UTEX 2973]